MKSYKELENAWGISPVSPEAEYAEMAYNYVLTQQQQKAQELGKALHTILIKAGVLLEESTPTDPELLMFAEGYISTLEETSLNNSKPIYESFGGDKGVWNEHPDYPREDWGSEAQANNTNLGYWDWVENQMRMAEDEADQGNGPSM